MAKTIFRDVSRNSHANHHQPELEARLRVRAEASGVSVETYMERFARDDQAAADELEVLASEGLNSGEAIEADKGYWEGTRQRLTDRHQKSGAQ